MAVTKRNRYSEGFRAEAVRRVVEDDLKVPELAKALKVPENVLYRWVRKAALKGAPGVRSAVPAEVRETVDEELKRLRRENAQLRMDQEILKKAAAFFAKESGNK
jgi:transposase